MFKAPGRLSSLDVYSQIYDAEASLSDVKQDERITKSKALKAFYTFLTLSNKSQALTANGQTVEIDPLLFSFSSWEDNGTMSYNSALLDTVTGRLCPPAISAAFLRGATKRTKYNAFLTGSAALAALPYIAILAWLTPIDALMSPRGVITATVCTGVLAFILWLVAHATKHIYIQRTRRWYAKKILGPYNGAFVSFDRDDFTSFFPAIIRGQIQANRLSKTKAPMMGRHYRPKMNARWQLFALMIGSSLTTNKSS